MSSLWKSIPRRVSNPLWHYLCKYRREGDPREWTDGDLAHRLDVLLATGEIVAVRDLDRIDRRDLVAALFCYRAPGYAAAVRLLIDKFHEAEGTTPPRPPTS